MKPQPGKIYYTIGLPIEFTKSSRSFFSFQFLSPHIDEISYKDNIEKDEITQALINKAEVCLFKTEEEALEYARFQREGRAYVNSILKQPAVYKIEYLGKEDTKKNERNETITINESASSHASIPYDERKRQSQIQYFVVKNENYNLLSATFKVHMSNQDKFHDFGTIDLSNQESQQQNRCNLL